jgi:hypothetical protein
MHVIRDLFCIKAGFPPVKSAESSTFRGLSFGKLHAFPHSEFRIPQLSWGKFQYTEESQNRTFEMPITTSKANFRQNFNHGLAVLP